LKSKVWRRPKRLTPRILGRHVIGRYREINNKMKAGITVIAIFTLVLGNCPAVFAYRFEDFQWGSALNQVYERLLNAKKYNLEEGTYFLNYEETIYGYPAHVRVIFTPDTNKLAKVSVIWSDISDMDVWKDIKRQVEKVYGYPNETDNVARQFTWYEGSLINDEKMVLDCGNRNSVVLDYYGGEYWRKFEEERKLLFLIMP